MLFFVKESENISFYEDALIIRAVYYHTLIPRIETFEDHKRYDFSIKYINRGIDFIILSSICNDRRVQNLIIPYFDNLEPAIVFIAINVYLKFNL